mgnify:CR=1 FL=1
MNWVIFLVRYKIFHKNPASWAEIEASTKHPFPSVSFRSAATVTKIIPEKNWTIFLFHFLMNVCSHEYRERIHLGGCYLLSHKDNLMFVFCKVCISLPATCHRTFSVSQVPKRVWLKVQWSTAKELRWLRQIIVSNQLHVEIIPKKLKMILEHFDPSSFKPVCMTQLFGKLLYCLQNNTCLRQPEARKMFAISFTFTCETFHLNRSAPWWSVVRCLGHRGMSRRYSSSNRGTLSNYLISRHLMIMRLICHEHNNNNLDMRHGQQ